MWCDVNVLVFDLSVSDEMCPHDNTQIGFLQLVKDVTIAAVLTRLWRFGIWRVCVGLKKE